jgi:phage protein D
MKHTVMGINEGDDFASYEHELPIKSEELAVLMGWKDQEDYVYDYQLTKEQITAIEQACSVSFPSDLILFLTTSQN